MPRNVPTNVELSEVYDSAAAIQWVADEFKKVADDMNARKIQKISATNTGNYEYGINRLRSALAGLQKGLGDSITSKGVPSETDREAAIDRDETHPAVLAAKGRTKAAGKRPATAKEKPKAGGA